MIELDFPWLQLAIGTPLAGAAVVSRVHSSQRAQWISMIVVCLTMIFGIAEWVNLGFRDAFEAADRGGFLGLGVATRLFVVDEFSAPLLPLSALLFLTTILATLRTKIHRFSFPWTLFSLALIQATFSSRNPWMIVLMMSLSVLPVWIELQRRQQATRLFAIHQVGMIVCLLLGQMLVSTGMESAILLGGSLLTMAALSRSGIFPLHLWVADLFHRSTFGTALLFTTPMTGAYAMMRLVFPIAPVWALQGIAVLSLFSAVYAAGLAIVQTDSRRFFCYLLISHMSLVLVGLEMATPLGVTAALCVWLAIGISMHGFGLALRCVEARTGRLSLAVFHGLHEHTPFLAGMFLLTGLASTGFPGTVGFIGTELLVESAVAIYPLVGFAVVVAAALNGIAVVKAYFHVFTGTTHKSTYSMTCRPLERTTILIIVLLNIGGGLAPQFGVSACYHAATELIAHRRSTPPSATDSHQESEKVEATPVAQSSHDVVEVP